MLAEACKDFLSSESLGFTFRKEVEDNLFRFAPEFIVPIKFTKILKSGSLGFLVPYELHREFLLLFGLSRLKVVEDDDAVLVLIFKSEMPIHSRKDVRGATETVRRHFAELVFTVMVRKDDIRSCVRDGFQFAKDDCHLVRRVLLFAVVADERIEDDEPNLLLLDDFQELCKPPVVLDESSFVEVERNEGIRWRPDTAETMLDMPTLILSVENCDLSHKRPLELSEKVRPFRNRESEGKTYPGLVILGCA